MPVRRIRFTIGSLATLRKAVYQLEQTLSRRYRPNEILPLSSADSQSLREHCKAGSLKPTLEDL